MIDLMNENLLPGELEGAKVEPKKSRTVYKDGYQMALVARVDGDTELLKLEEGSEETVNLDDALTWRQVKVKEKVVQLFAMVSGGKNESRVLRYALNFLRDHGRIGSKTFTDYLMSQGYSIGTARAQASQIVNLFSNLKITVKGESSVYDLNENSLVYKRVIQAI